MALGRLPCLELLTEFGLVGLARAELGEKRVDAVTGGGVALDLSVPSAAGGVVDELLLDGQAGAESGCVVAGSKELRAGQDEVAFAWPFGGGAQAVTQFKFGLQEVGLQP